MDKPLISVIVPVYNVEQYLGECMKSICSQSYKNIEIIMIDDGSKDSSASMCDEWKLRDSRIKVIHKENGGLSDARNCGMEYANGEFLMFVDSDDFIHQDIISYLYALMKNNNADIGICDPIHCYPGEIVLFEDEKNHKIFNSEEAVCKMFYQTSFLVSAWGKLYRTKCFQNVKFPVEMLFEDSAVMYKVFEKANNIVYGDAKLYAYMHRHNSITTGKFSIKDLDILTICQQIMEYYHGKSVKIERAARSYKVAASLRIYLNAPCIEFSKSIDNCKLYLKKNAMATIRDSHIRCKMRFALLLFIFARPVMRIVYHKINRWK